jgi:hypothetical protein
MTDLDGFLLQLAVVALPLAIITLVVWYFGGYRK